jgi:protein-disulfide isomerase
VTATRRSLLAASALLAAAPAVAQRAAPRPERTLVGAELAALQTPDEGLEERVLGSPDAKVTLIEYASMTCPHCATFHNDVLPVLKSRYVDSGQMRVVFRHFLLNILDAGASMLARCAPTERYFPMIDVLFQQQRQWAAASDPVASLRAIARQAGFSQESFDACLRDQALLDRLNAARDRGAQRFGVSSTPTLFINGQMYRGALRVEEIEAIITPMLRA